MEIEITGVYSSISQLEADLKKRGLNSNQHKCRHLITADAEQYASLKESSTLEVKLLETAESKEDIGIHSLATAFDEDDGSLQLMRLEKELRNHGFSQKDAAECSTYLHKGMIVAAEEV
jgi:glutathionylspermidine synthase